MKQNNNNDWFVLYTKARQELKVLERLTHLGIKVSLMENTVFLDCRC